MSSPVSIGEVLFSSVDKVFVINLDRRKDRLREMEAQFASIGLGFDHDKIERFSAISPDQIAGFPSLGARGCFLSHLEILKWFQNSDWSRVAILEDDADFDLPDIETLQRYLQNLENHKFDIFYGGYHFPDRFAEMGAGIHDLTEKLIIGGTHCYILDRSILERLILFLEDVQRKLADGIEVDGFIDNIISSFWIENQDCRVKIAVPAFAFQRRSATDIHAPNPLDTIPVIRNLTNLARKLAPRRKS